MIYVPLHIIREELISHYEKYHKCTSLPMICQKLRKQPDLFVSDYRNPFPESFENLADDAFIKYFYNSLYPLEKTVNAIDRHSDMFSYLSDTLFSKHTLFFVFLHENFAKQNPHRHDYFEIVYVFRGKCTMAFENSSIGMEEGNVCIIAPQTLHEAFVLDRESFIVNFSMTKEAFESAFSTVFLRRDLVSSYIHTILYQEDMPNYLFIPSNNSKYIKDAAKHIIYESRNTSSYSSSFCVSWLSVFICSVLDNYQADIQIYDDKKNSTQVERMAMLEYIQNNFRTVTLDSVAECFNYNKSYLSRLITQLTGKTFKDIITELKLKAGCELLENTDFSLEKISELIGYRSGDYFSKAFKKTYHMSAAKYREEHLASSLST